MDTEIFGVNPASVEAHKKYKNSKEFNFHLLSDNMRKTVHDYEALKENGSSILRTVYIIDKEGKIRFAERGMPDDAKLLEAISSF